jgi:hypothetical protein
MGVNAIRRGIAIGSYSRDLKDLCEARAERDELLWLLHGCDGLPGFTRTEEVFGLAAQDLRNSLATIERAANVIERMYSYTFGLLARHTLTSSLDEELRSYVALARQARTDFGHGSQWFVNIAKARLVIHVRSRTNGAVHDKEISALISAMTDTSYAPSAQSRWRHKHSDLIRDDSLDPYTVMNQRDRKRKRKKWEELAAVDPAFRLQTGRQSSQSPNIPRTNLRRRSAHYRPWRERHRGCRLSSL